MIDSHWVPGTGAQALKARATLYRRIRAFFDAREVLEVETPLLSQAGNTDPHLNNLKTECPPGYLQTSPEFAMKRLLAAGSGPIYQICKAFRGEEQGRRHNTEFTLLEWYRPGFDLSQLQREVADIVMLALGQLMVEHVSYRQLFQRHLQLDPFAATERQLADCAKEKTGFESPASRDELLDLLLTHCIEPHLGKGCLTFVEQYPASQCALARLEQDDQGDWVAQRFELYAEGLELANGYYELTDAGQQRGRFEQDQLRRSERGLAPIPYDKHLIAALESGLPDCAGVALGLDRLLMLQLNAGSIDEVISFAFDRA